MKTSFRMTRLATAVLLGMGIVSLTACQSAPKPDPAVAIARAELTDLQSTPKLASRAQSAIDEAELAVVAAEKPQKDAAVQAHLAYLATNKVRAARAVATARNAEDGLKDSATQRDQMRLNARTQEANQARAQAESAKLQTTAAQLRTTQAEQRAAAAAQQSGFSEQQANDARMQAFAADQRATDAASDKASADQLASDANSRNAELERELAFLNAKKTDRGIVFTLGDVLFASGKADLRSGAMANFDRLAESLRKQPGRNLTIEGHTDSVGSDDLNLALSQRRADAVKNYLVSRGVAAGSINTIGKGESSPLASNDSASGRQQNRRVEVIIENETSASSR